MKKVILALYIMFSFILISGCGSKSNHPVIEKSQAEDGIYLIDRSGDDLQALLPASDSEKVITFNQEFIDKTDPGVKYLVINTKEFVPLKLNAEPVTEEQPDKRKKLLLSLTQDAKIALAEFTEKNMNRLTSIVVGGQALTMHKVKAVIDSGQLQISRCTDNACELLYVELKDNITIDR